MSRWVSNCSGCAPGAEQVIEPVVRHLQPVQ